MGDFDFEELDKAVNNVLGDPTPTDRNVAQDARSNSTEVAKKPVPGADNADSKNQPTTQSPVIMPSRGSAGRSDVRPVIDIMAPSRRPSREGPIVAPSPRGVQREPLSDSQPAAADAISPVRDTPVAASASDAPRGEESLSLEPNDRLTHEPKSEANLSLDVKDDALEAASAAVSSMSASGDAPLSQPEAKPDDPADLTKFNDLSRSTYSHDSSSEEESLSLSETDKPVTDAPSDAASTSAAEAEAPASVAVDSTDVDTTSKPAADPVDLSSVQEELKKAADDMPSNKDEAKTSTEPDSLDISEPDADKEPAAPAVSPFLSDAKVEKRPLGGGAVSTESGTQTDESSSKPSAGGTPEHIVAGGQPHGNYAFSDDHQEMKVDAGADAPRPVFDTKEYHAPTTGGNSIMQKLGGNGLLFGAIGLLVVALIIAVVVFFFL